MANEYFGGGYDSLSKKELDLVWNPEPEWSEEDVEQFLIQLEKEKRREELNNQAWDEYIKETEDFARHLISQVKIVEALLDSIKKSCERRNGKWKHFGKEKLN